MARKTVPQTTVTMSDQSRGAEGRSTVVLLTTDGPLPNIIVNDLARHIERLVVLREDGPPRGAMMKSRAKLLGWPTAIGQTAANYLFKFVRKASARRVRDIEAAFDLDREDHGQVETIRIGSVNAERCRDALKRLDPAVVAVYSTGIIKTPTLDCVPAPFINYHAGINPKYRGQDPAYWALVEGDPDHAGITIHLVDEGVDTGDVLYQEAVDFSGGGNITTYPHRQVATALPHFRRAIDDALKGRLAPKTVDLPSRQWFPPTLRAYLWNGVTRGIW